MQNKRGKLAGLTVLAVALAGLSTAAVGQQGTDMGPGRHAHFGGGFGGGFERIFAEIDTDKDGKITLAEVESWKAAQPKVEDGNADGKISAEELAAPMIAEATKRAQERAARMVRELDTDGDGLLSAAELAQGRVDGPGARHDPARLFQRLDADGDGVITRDEAAKSMARMHGDRMKGHGPKGDGPGREGRHGPGKSPMTPPAGPEGQPEAEGGN